MTSAPFAALVRAPVRRSALYMGAVAAAVLILAIANSGASVAFSIGATPERIVNALVTVNLVVVALVLGAGALIVTRRDAAVAAESASVVDQQGRSVPATSAGQIRRTGILAVVGVLFTGTHWILWLAFGFPTLLGGMLAHATGIYLGTATFTVIFAPLLALGTVFSVLGFHRGGARVNRTLSLVGAGLGVLMMGVSVTTALLCATGLIR